MSFVNLDFPDNPRNTFDARLHVDNIQPSLFAYCHRNPLYSTTATAGQKRTERCRTGLGPPVEQYLSSKLRQIPNQAPLNPASSILQENPHRPLPCYSVVQCVRVKWVHQPSKCLHQKINSFFFKFIPLCYITL